MHTFVRINLELYYIGHLITILFMFDKHIISIEEYGLKMEYEPNDTTLTSRTLTPCLWADVHRRFPKSI